jgi:hypothetical protein
MLTRGFRREAKQFGVFVQTKFSLTEGSIPRALLAFTMPILLGNVLQGSAAPVPTV